MPIHCAVAFRDESGSYYQNTYITLLSLLKNSSSKLVIHILHDETIEYGREALKQLCEQYGQHVEFHKVPPIPGDIVKLSSKRFNISVLYRLYIHEFIQADRAVYFDSDLIIQCDVAELNTIELNGKAAAAVLNEGGHWDKKTRARKESSAMVAKGQLSPNTYFNSGVMLYDLDKMREVCKGSNIFWNIFREFYQKNLHLPYPDQDVLNIYCARYGGVLLLDNKFNYQLYAKGRMYESVEQLDNKILHYAALETKPQAVLFPAQLRFWKYYAMTPWGGDVFEQMSKAFYQPGMSLLKNYIKYSRRRNTLNTYASGGLRGLIRTRLKKIFKVK